MASVNERVKLQMKSADCCAVITKRNESDRGEIQTSLPSSSKLMGKILRSTNPCVSGSVWYRAPRLVEVVTSTSASTGGSFRGNKHCKLIIPCSSIRIEVFVEV